MVMLLHTVEVETQKEFFPSDVGETGTGAWENDFHRDIRFGSSHGAS